MCRMNDRSRLELFCPGIAALILLPHITVLRSALWPSGDPGQLHLLPLPLVYIPPKSPLKPQEPVPAERTVQKENPI